MLGWHERGEPHEVVRDVIRQEVRLLVRGDRLARADDSSLQRFRDGGLQGDPRLLSRILPLAPAHVANGSDGDRIDEPRLARRSATGTLEDDAGAATAQPLSRWKYVEPWRGLVPLSDMGTKAAVAIPVLVGVLAIGGCRDAGAAQDTPGAAAGDTATWELLNADQVKPESAVLRLGVTRLGCASGKTGTVLERR